MLKWNKDGLYYGTTPDASTANLYVDTVNGVDVKPTIENKAGTRQNPLRTIKFAVESGGIGNERVVHLMENQEHIIDSSTGDAGVVFINNSKVFLDLTDPYLIPHQTHLVIVDFIIQLF